MGTPSLTTCAALTFALQPGLVPPPPRAALSPMRSCSLARCPRLPTVSLIKTQLSMAPSCSQRICTSLSLADRLQMKNGFLFSQKSAKATECPSKRQRMSKDAPGFPLKRPRTSSPSRILSHGLLKDLDGALRSPSPALPSLGQPCARSLQLWSRYPLYQRSLKLWPKFG